MKIFWGLGILCVLIVGGCGSCDSSARSEGGQDVLETVLSSGIKQELQEQKATSTGLPRAFVDAAESMFDHGLGDPRGGEYRAVTITVYDSVIAEEKQLETVGWVFPKTKNQPAYVVCWDGLIYLADKIGNRSDIVEDMADKDMNNIFSRDQSIPIFLTTRDIANALLYRLGVLGTEEVPNRVTVHNAQYAYVQMLESYSLSLYHRGIGAFLAGEDEIAYRDLFSVVAMIKKPAVVRANQDSNRGPKPLAFLADVEDLMNDVGDRLEHPRKLETEWSKIKLLGPEARTYTLLNLIATYRQAPYNRITYDPDQSQEPSDYDAVLSAPKPENGDRQAWAEYNKAIVAALFQSPGCSVNLVAQVGQEKNHFMRSAKLPERYSFITGVREKERVFTRIGDLAEELIEKRLGHPVADDLTDAYDRLDRLVAYWDRYGHLDVPERQLQVLRDDDRSDRAWAQAVRVLVSQEFQGSDLPMKLKYADFVEQNRKEILDLLAMRAEQTTDFRALNRIAESTAMIDPETALQMVHRTIKLVSEKLDSGGSDFPHKTAFVTRQMSPAVTIAMRYGDKTIAANYVKLVKKAMPENSLLRMADTPGLQLFANESAFMGYIQDSYKKFYQEWSLSPTGHGNDDRPRDYLNAMFLRSSLIRLLEQDRDYMTARLFPAEENSSANIGSGETVITYTVGARLEYENLSNNGSGSMGVRLGEGDEMYINLERKIRPCDMVAYDLFDAGFGLEFQYYWPREKRDRAITELRSLLKREPYAPKLQYSSKHDDWWFSSEPIARSR